MKTSKKRACAHNNCPFKRRNKFIVEKDIRKKNKSSPCVSTRISRKKQADDFIIEFGSDIAHLKENLV